MQIELTSVLARSTDVVYSETDGEVTMMNVKSGDYFSLAEAGARIWSLLEQPGSVASVCDRLVSEYDVDRAQCESDVLRLARRMADEGVVTVTGSPRPD